METTAPPSVINLEIREIDGRQDVAAAAAAAVTHFRWKCPPAHVSTSTISYVYRDRSHAAETRQPHRQRGASKSPSMRDCVGSQLYIRGSTRRFWRAADGRGSRK